MKHTRTSFFHKPWLALFTAITFLFFSITACNPLGSGSGSTTRSFGDLIDTHIFNDAEFLDTSSKNHAVITAFLDGAYSVDNVNGNVEVWDLSTGKLVKRIIEKNISYSGAYSPDATLLAVDKAENIQLFNTSDYSKVAEIATPTYSEVDLINFNHDASRLAARVTKSINKITIWDISDIADITVDTTIDSDTVNYLIFDNDGSHLAYLTISDNSDDGDRIVILNTSDYSTALSIDVEDVTIDGEIQSASINKIRYNHDGTRIAGYFNTSGDGGGYIQIWNTTDGSLVTTLFGNSKWINDITYNSDDSLLASAGGDKIVRVWDTATNELLITLTGHSNQVYNVRFSQGILASVSYTDSESGNMEVKVWDMTREVSSE